MRKEKSLFLDLVNAQSEINGATAVDGFISGFPLGARIALEIMSDEENMTMKNAYGELFKSYPDVIDNKR